MESFARKHRCLEDAHDLAGLCAISSFFFAMVGKKLGYHLTLVEGIAFDGDVKRLQNGEQPRWGGTANHCWVEYNGKIIDITATQFRSKLKKIHVVKDDNKNYWQIHKHNQARHQLKTQWYEEQSPYFYITELRKRAKELSIKLAA